MPQAIVDGLEPIKIDEEQGEQATGSPGDRDGMLRALMQERAVGKPGQRIVGSDEVEMLLAFPKRGFRLDGSAELNIFLL